ncbi:insulinase family protein [Shewanella baltica]|uniref:M16 family metallopeptidase n=1 Tax=Shewanella baltica TaxID=62322 RepID=UPI00217E30A4|nr:insulinase family protein [Shewanella baltica]MCS6128017.1 insulinase family protein [Shewanella baltica]MCS6140116.1 insulinase family protein [Shewanella baltica]MCS6146257.1 insulinase family protein [Shewanella baltica]MCS6170761.1 insulinase family protein [Shewanella baltica]MCS6188011.1 insulinase family protein [Shewanella baltica]
MMNLTPVAHGRPKQLQGLMCCVVALLLSACQQTQIVFTPTEPPSLASFEIPYPLDNHLPESGVIIPATDPMFSDEVHTELDLPYQLHRLASVQSTYDLSSNSLSNRVSLAVISPQTPFNNPDTLQIALQEKARALAISLADPCLETFSIRVSLHSINLSLTCPDDVNHIYGLLVQFWQPNTFIDATTAPVDIDNIRRQLKLNKHLNAFSGAEIDKQWREKLLGPEHPYNKVLNNDALFDTLSLKQLQQIQQQAASQAQWHLFLPNMQAKNAEFDLQASIKLWPLLTTSFPKSSPQADKLETTTPKQTKKIFLIDAPGSVQTQVRLGYRIGYRIDHSINHAIGHTVDSELGGMSETSQLNSQEVALSCRSLSALMGRSFSGRLYYDLREKRGLTYGIYGQCANAPLSSSIKFYGSTAIEHTGAFVVGILDHLALVKTQSASQGEINALKTYLIGEDLLSQDNSIQRENQYLQQLATGLTQVDVQKLNAELQALTPKRLQQLANGAFSGEPLIILRGDIDRIIPDLTSKLPEWQLERVKVD